MGSMKYQNLKSFQKQLASAAPHNLCRLYFLSVADDFERSKAIDALLSYVLTPDAPFSKFSGNESSLRDVLDALQSPSLLGGEPVVVLDDADKLGKKEAESLASVLSKGVTFGYLVIGAKGKSSLLQVCEKEGVVLDLGAEKPWDKEKRLTEQLVERAKSAGKALAAEAAVFLVERVGADSAFLESEIDKLICYTGEKNRIGREDVLSISVPNKTETLWHMAEEIVWERSAICDFDPNSFHPLAAALRAQLELGLKIATLIEAKCPPESWASHLPKVWPKTLEKRTSQAARLGSRYFQKGLDALFEMELISRSGSNQLEALIDYFRVKLYG